MKKDKYNYLVKNTFLLAISQFGTKFLSFFLVPLYTFVLSTNDYGDADLIQTTAAILVFIFTLNITEAVLRFAIEKKKDQVDFFKFGQKVIVVGTCILSFLVIILSKYNFIGWKPYYYLFILFYFFFTATSSLCTNYLRAIDKVKEVAISGILNTAIIITTNILFLLVFRIGLVGFLTSYILGNVAVIIYCYLIIRPSFGRDYKSSFDSKTRKAMFVYCIPLIFNSLAWWVNSSLDKYFILAISGSGANGIYAVASKIPSILSIVLTVFIQAWNLSALKEFDKNDTDGFFAKIYRSFNTVLILTCSVLIILNITLSRFLFLNDFFVAWRSASILLLAGVFNGLANFIGTIFSAMKRSKVIALTTVIIAVLNTVLNIILIPAYGIEGAAMATAISFFIFWLIRLIIVRKYIKWRIPYVGSFVCYALLVLQLIIERSESRFYFIQIVIFLALVILNIKNLMLIINAFISKVIRKKENVNE